MITDGQTNLLYLSDLLPVRFPLFFAGLERIIRECEIRIELLPGTRDIWAVDYMPVQVDTDHFVKFVYDPGYLKNNKDRLTKTDTAAVCNRLGIRTLDSDIILDGGNVVRSGSKVILCDRIFTENPGRDPERLTKDLKRTLKAAQVIILPTQPCDEFGHADGLLRFYDENTVLLSDLSHEGPGFRREFIRALEEAGLRWMSIPYNPYGNDNDTDATGVYINYLQMKGHVIVPWFNLPEDDAVLEQFRMLFRDCKVYQLDCREIAEEGGVLNCISWNICWIRQ